MIRVEIPETHQGERRAREMFVFCCITGIRYSDLVNLKWDHINTKTNEMKFEMNKTKYFVTIPLIDRAPEILERQAKNSESVFKRITNQKLNEHLLSLEKRTGIQKRSTVHVARHTFATLALERKMTLESVSKIPGHQNLKTTMVYAKITTKILRTEMQKLNTMFNSLMKPDATKETMHTLMAQMQNIMQQMQTVAEG